MSAGDDSTGLRAFETHFMMGGTLGSGAFSTVKRCTRRADNSALAVKCVRRAHLETRDEYAMQTEVSVLRRVEHDKIVRLLEVVDTPKTCFMVVDLMDGGELLDRVAELEVFTEGDAARVVRDIAEALVYLHAAGLVHRNLKPENVLYPSRTAASAWDLKVADCGIAKLWTKRLAMHQACGNLSCVSPEVLEDRGDCFDAATDLWSLGAILFMLLCGHPPFEHSNPVKLFDMICQARYNLASETWSHVSGEAKAVVLQLLRPLPSDRLTAEQLLRVPWVAGAHDTAPPLGTLARECFDADVESGEGKGEGDEGVAPGGADSDSVVGETTRLNEGSDHDVEQPGDSQRKPVDDPSFSDVFEDLLDSSTDVLVAQPAATEGDEATSAFPSDEDGQDLDNVPVAIVCADDLPRDDPRRVTAPGDLGPALPHMKRYNRRRKLRAGLLLARVAGGGDIFNKHARVPEVTTRSPQRSTQARGAGNESEEDSRQHAIESILRLADERKIMGKKAGVARIMHAAQQGFK